MTRRRKNVPNPSSIESTPANTEAPEAIEPTINDRSAALDESVASSGVVGKKRFGERFEPDQQFYSNLRSWLENESLLKGFGKRIGLAHKKCAWFEKSHVAHVFEEQIWIVTALLLESRDIKTFEGRKQIWESMGPQVTNRLKTMPEYKARIHLWLTPPATDSTISQDQHTHSNLFIAFNNLHYTMSILEKPEAELQKQVDCKRNYFFHSQFSAYCIARSPMNTIAIDTKELQPDYQKHSNFKTALPERFACHEKDIKHYRNFLKTFDSEYTNSGGLNVEKGSDCSAFLYDQFKLQVRADNNILQPIRGRVSGDTVLISYNFPESQYKLEIDYYGVFPRERLSQAVIVAFQPVLVSNVRVIIPRCYATHVKYFIAVGPSSNGKPNQEGNYPLLSHDSGEHWCFKVESLKGYDYFVMAGEGVCFFWIDDDAEVPTS